MKVIFRHIVPDDPPRVRLDRYLADELPHFPSKSSVKKAAKRGEILVDGEKCDAGAFVVAQWCVEVLQGAVPSPQVFRLPLEVVYEDETIAVVNKPPGFPVTGNRHRTVQHALPFNLQRATGPEALQDPLPAHRLDAPTGGLLVVAKTRPALAALGHAFQERRVEKEYRAIVVGRLEGEGWIEQDVDGRNAATRYSPVLYSRSLKSQWLTTVALFPKTGRTHQLRQHMLFVGTPILGDSLYHHDGLLFRGKGLFLCAIRLRFPHPVTGDPLEISIDEPSKFVSLRQRENRRWEKYFPS